MGRPSENSPSSEVRGCEIIIFQSLKGANFFKKLKLLGQLSKSGAKGMKMIRTTLRYGFSPTCILCPDRVSQ